MASQNKNVVKVNLNERISLMAMPIEFSLIKSGEGKTKEKSLKKIINFDTTLTSKILKMFGVLYLFSRKND